MRYFINDNISEMIKIKNRVNRKYVSYGESRYLTSELNEQFESLTYSFNKEEFLKFEKYIDKCLREKKLKRILK